MLIDFFQEVHKHKVPCSVREYLDLVRALEANLAFANIEDFYALSRLCLVKDEKYYDRFDRAFASYFDGIEQMDVLEDINLPAEWMRKEFERILSEEDKAKLEGMGGLDKLMETLKERLKEQHKRHQGGNKMIGTGGVSPFGANGYNPEGMRIDQGQSRHNRAVKVWEKRQFRNLDDSRELGTRNLKMVLRRLRRFARQGASDELDMDGTIASTAKNAGYLNIKMVPERHNAAKVLLFFDVGGSMDPYIKLCEELFSAARSEFKHMEIFYFHNCLYESVWKNNFRRMDERTDTWEILRKYGSDYRVIFVGDAMMAPYEVSHQGGSVEHWNEESGATWLTRVVEHFDQLVWLNPMSEEYWGSGGSLGMIRELIENQMYSMTLAGIEKAIQQLTK